MKRAPIRTAAAALCALVMLSLLTASAALPARAAAKDVIYIAGNPDLYPVEYYDLDSKSFAGILPLIMERVSDKTGLSFRYINEGRDGDQHRLAKNKQAELITAYVPDPKTEKYLNGSYTVMTVPLDGTPTDICIAYTLIASPQLKDEIDAALSELSREELAEAAIAFTIGKEAPRNRIVPLVLLSIGLLLALGGIVFLLILMAKRKRRNVENDMIDSATGMGNSAYFAHYFNAFINDRNRSLYYVLYIAFDIRWVNQYVGTDAADTVLRDAASIIRDHARDTDIPARVAGGGFGIACLCDNTEDAIQYTLELLARLNAEFSELSVDFHGGIYPLGTVNCHWDSALSNAEMGYLRAKREKVPYVVCTQDILKDAAMTHKLQEQTAAGIKNREFMPYLQMTVDAATGLITGAELLSRWQNPSYGLLTPGRYIDIMEEAGTIVELDFYMFEEACRYLVHCAEVGRRDFYISCNFSRRTISRADFTERLFAIARRYEFPRSLFIIEITEDVLETNKEAALKNARACREFGFRLALDDMGSGYTSFINLCEYPIDVVKLDRSIVIGAAEMDRGAIMVNAIIAMAHHMEMLVVCEGVETEAQDAIVKQAGADFIQGFRYSRVIPMEETDRFIRLYNEKLSVAVKAARTAPKEPEKKPAPPARESHPPKKGPLPALPDNRRKTALPSPQPSLKEKLSCTFTKHIFTRRR